jgi:hypothetical protein
MGFAPQVVDGMSMAEFAWAAYGFSKANGGETDEGLGAAEISGLSAVLDSLPIAGMV